MSEEARDLEREERAAGGPVGEEEMKALKDDLKAIRTEISSAVVEQRAKNADTRLCRWDGQSADGRKHKADLGKEAFPFEGGSDSRQRLADKIINERRDDYVAAATRATPRVRGMEGTDEGRAGKVETLVRWLIRSQWGSRYRQEIELLGQWMEGDTPALAVLGIFWREEMGIEPRAVTVVDVLGELARRQEGGLDEAALTDLAVVFETPGLEDQAAGLLEQIYDGLTASDARRAARELTKTGEALLPLPYLRVARPELEALRVYEDVFFRAWLTDVQRAPRVYLRRWLTKAEVLENAGREGWSTEFATELLGEEGEVGKAGQSTLDMPSDESVTDVGASLLQTHKDLYEVIWCYSRAATRSGAVGIYTRVFSGLCETAATDRTLLGYGHGEYPFVAFARERLTRRLIDSRSTSELAATPQQTMKLVSDSVEDHVQALTNPPLIVSSGNAKYQAALAPFGQIERFGRDKPEFLERPPYPLAADKHMERVGRETDDYFGRENAELPPGRAVQARQTRVDRFLGYLGDGLMQAVQLCQQYMTDEQIARVVGGAGLQAPRTLAEIQGKFDMLLSFDVRDLDNEFILKKAEMLLKIRPFDTRGQLPWTQWVTNIVAAVDPNWADQIPPAAVAEARIITEEQDNFVRIMAGVEPEMPEKPEAPELRGQVLMSLWAPRQQNPVAYGPMPAMAAAIFENRMKYLTQAQTQERNALIGRVGTEPVEQGER